MSVRGMHTFLKICIQRTYNVLCISNVLKCIFLILQIICQWGKKLKNILVSVCIKILFLTLTPCFKYKNKIYVFYFWILEFFQ